MSTPPNSPLTDQHLQQIQAALSASTIAEQQIALAKRAGLDVSQLEQQLIASKEKLLALKSTYFPNA